MLANDPACKATEDCYNCWSENIKNEPVIEI